ncbi:benzil reductase ((S)-benzoin forming) [Tenacibaculum adriaticum]|uniref:Benzil reductase ((S)-benzoin forming) n=1 Tax=Tenacibaculum adriaticum TaxID=413713 RepID=A0A5S5DSE9_9FLAO|nr:SDR family NAD(P)-dependent oxidoreductase [Tenacibaculum adriaticum]TYP98811.1 benzil reductase ((S)-benzoin forming) [Tenacibaculum adriaticum]
MKKIAIITGGSKGIGKALAEKYVSENYTVYSLSRSIVDIQNVTQISVDLSDTKETTLAFKRLFANIDLQNVSSITLINNAGRLGKIANLENLDSEDITKTILLNITTPLILSSLFINLTQELTCKKQIINISSGAAVNPYAGWSVYCTSKAAIDMLTRNITEEQKEIENGVKCFGIRPGVVDTNMQTTIRSTDPSDFKNLQKFIDLKENKQLFSTEYVAETIFKLDTENRINSGNIIDIRDF